MNSRFFATAGLCLGLTTMVGCDFGSTGSRDGRPTRPNTADTYQPPQADTYRPPQADTYQPPHDTAVPPADCNADLLQCAGPDAMRYCDQGQVVVQDCASICDDSGYDLSTGCAVADDGAAACFCDYRCDDTVEFDLCLDDDSLERCEGETWVVDSCSDICLAAGALGALGCGADATANEDSCICDWPVTPPPTCSPMGAECLSSNAISVCDGQNDVIYNCDSVCANDGMLSVGCGWDDFAGEAACFCEPPPCPVGSFTCGDGSCVNPEWTCDGVSDCADGTDEWDCSTCFEGDTLCVDNWTIEICEDDSWSVLDCDDVCNDAGFAVAEGCGLDNTTQVDACFCQALPTCDVGFAACDDGSCIPQGWWCDGMYEDCNDGSDEYYCQ